MKINRRDFLTGLCLILASGKILSDVCKKEYQKYLIDKIYQLPKHIHLIKNTTTVNFLGDKLEKIVQKGYGIVLNNKLIQPAHFFNNGEREMRMDSSISTEIGEVVRREANLYGKKSDKVSLDRDLDMAVIDMPAGLDLPNLPCEPRGAKLGEEIYLIGNPYLQGWNIRKGYVSDLDEAKDSEFTKGCFGISIPIIYGDSGCPVVSKDYKLLGLARSFNYRGLLGYVTKIDKYIKKIENENNKRT